MKNKKNNLLFERYSSKTKRVNIPIPSFDLVHKIDASKPFLYLIGRDRITEKLRSWLTSEKGGGGAYLITGFRGMGKSSFVNKVLYELTREADFWCNLSGYIAFVAMITYIYLCGENSIRHTVLPILTGGVFFALFHYWYVIFEKLKKCAFLFEVCLQYLKKAQKYKWKKLKNLKAKEWERINRFLNNGVLNKKRFANLCINVNLGQEILDEREILCVLTAQLHNKYRSYVLSPTANAIVWLPCATIAALSYQIHNHYGYSYHFTLNLQEMATMAVHWVLEFSLPICACFTIIFHQWRVMRQLNVLRKRIDAAITLQTGAGYGYNGVSAKFSRAYNYPIATTREIEFHLIDIINKIINRPFHPKLFFVFDELDKIEVPYNTSEETQPEYSNEKYLSGGGTSRKRKTTVLHLLGNLKFFTSTAKAKFLFIAGREMYDAYLADLTDRESAISSLFNGIIYVESFCKNEKSEKDVMYNAETFITRQLIPHSYIKKKVIDRYIECKLNDELYTNIDINLKLYFEYLTTAYAKKYLGKTEDKNSIRLFNDVRVGIDKAIILLYHFTFYLYHISNGSPKKMRLTFENFIRPIKNPNEFKLSKNKMENPLEKADLDIHIPKKCHNLLSFGEKEQRIIGFIHYISFPVNQVFTDANQYGDKLLVSASFLINHIYKYHNGGFSWRNIEQTPELLEVYKIPEFRSFIDSILKFLLQTHIIQIPCGLYQYKFRKHISEEISLASKISEEVSAIFNFTLDESQTVKRHYMEIQKRHLALLDEEGADSPHSTSGIHHILGDLYMADEEYNNAIFEYQTALRILSETKEFPGQDSHTPSLMLAYMRCMLKLGAAYEKRRTLSSAYNTYNEVIDRLFKFREFKEDEFGLRYKMRLTEEWPYHEAVLYKENYITSKNVENPIEPEILPKRQQDLPPHLEYKTTGENMISDFSYLMTPDKHTVIQRLALLEDTPMIYQALLAKLFINEKIELGGITRAHLDTIEGEYQYLHLTANEKEKFLISTDFFRRLGDIMYYKNGLIGFNLHHKKSENKANEEVVGEYFIDSLYYWAIDIKSEIHDFCRQNKCFEKFGSILSQMRKLEPVNERIKFDGLDDDAKEFVRNCDLEKKIEALPMEDIMKCNKWRLKQWTNNKNLPCYACKFYNRSLRILMSQLFNVKVEQEKKDSKYKSKTLVILREIVKGGTSRSMRKNFMQQFGELLDCLGNTMLSCANMETDDIRVPFLTMFLHDANKLNEGFDQVKDINDFKLLSINLQLSKLETCILYYWEASICFRYGNEHKKAAESIKKILRVFQNFLRVSERMDEGRDEYIYRKILIGEFLNEIKNRLVKQSLISLYSHYDYINLMEIQRLKWIFSVQMYENISLSRLSLFPDVEEIMIIYYELIRLCVIPERVKKIVRNDKQADYFLETIRNEHIRKYSRDSSDEVAFSWDNIEKRNEDFMYRLAGIYNNMSMGALSHHHTIYERVLSLRFKAMMNQYVLEMTFPEMQGIQGHDLTCTNEYVKIFCDYFGESEGCKGTDRKTWEAFFRHINFKEEDDGNSCKVEIWMKTLEFLIWDSIYCLTEILETLTPYTSTTLFTNSFMGSIYRSLHKWNVLFDSLFKFYRVFDDENDKSSNHEESDLQTRFMQYDNGNTYLPDCHCSCDAIHQLDDERKSTQSRFIEQEKKFRRGNIQKKWQSRCPYYHILNCTYKTNDLNQVRERIFEITNKAKNPELFNKIRKSLMQVWNCHSISDRFFEYLMAVIDKPNNLYTQSNYLMEMALKSYRNTIEVHREGKAYKDMISKMYYLDDDLKNDTVQFDLAVERFKINNGYIDMRIKDLMAFETNSLYDIENFCVDNESNLPLNKRFLGVSWNVSDTSANDDIDDKTQQGMGSKKS